MEFQYHIFYACLRLWFLVVETSTGPWHPVSILKYFIVICSAWPWTLVAWSWLRLSMISCCAETLVLYMRHMSGLLVSRFGCPVLCQGRMPWACGMAAYIRDGNGAFRKPKFECCEILVFKVCGERQNLYEFSLYCNTDQDDQIFDCLLASIAAVWYPCLFPICLLFEWFSSGVVRF